MSERIRIGIIGTSGYAKLLLNTLTEYDDAEFAAICGRTCSRAAELAAEHQIDQVFTDYHDMIKNGRLDGIIVASPDDLHYPMTMAALEAGLHVLCEKPMATNVEQARQMLEAAERAGAKHMIEFSWRWMPHYQYLHQLVSDGFVGQGYHYHYRFLSNTGRLNDYTWRFDPRRSIGVLGDLGSHMVDLALWISGDITGVGAHLASFSERTDPDGHPFAGANESALLSVEFADGAQGMIHVSTIVESGIALSCVRAMVEPLDPEPNDALAHAEAIERELAAGGAQLEQVHHGDGIASWAVNRRAVGRGHGIRTGLEDTPVLPDGRLASGNGELIAAAASLLLEQLG